MNAAKESKRYFGETKLMVVDTHKSTVVDSRVRNLVDYFEKGDVVVVNRSGTLPSSFRGTVRGTHNEIEIRLAAFRGKNSSDLSQWAAVTFGKGDWRQTTERRGAAPRLHKGDIIEFSKDLHAHVTAVDERFSRLLQIEFHADNLIKALYEHGTPIQYSYLKEPIQVWDQQSVFSGPPISVEPPSASFPFTWEILFALQSKGVVIVPLLHGAGLSSTGDPELDKQFPLKEYFEIPPETLNAIRNAKRVIAVGTSVARAIESIPSSENYTTLRLGPSFQRANVDALITGMHEPDTSHAELMKAFCPEALLLKSIEQANEKGYRSHEYGDLTLILS